MNHKLLFAPFRIGNVELKNRVVVLPYGTSMVHNGVLNDADIAHYDAIASSGVSLIITGGSVVHPSSAMKTRKLVEIYDERTFDALRKRCDVIHGHGAKLFGQLLHVGREMLGLESDYPPSAPSALRSPRDPFPPHELDKTEIATLVLAFGRAALNLKRTGYDGVEIHGAHGYLVTQFLSPSTNHRTDGYGGTPERRLRFLLEVIESIRENCGTDFGLGVRLSATEELSDGLEIADTARIAAALAANGGVDVLNITVGVKGNYVKDMTAPDATAANAALAIKKASGLPVIVGQRISRPEVAERLLAEGNADLIGMARAFLADPTWLKKVAADEVDRIRPCLNVNQDCRARTPHLHCSINPETGRELLPEFRSLIPAPTVKRIAVIGGGPGGLDAAVIAAKRGHQVTLFEATDSLGGQFLYASAVPRRNGLLRLINYQVGELRRLPVQVKLGVAVNSVEDLGGEFDTAIVATGAVANPVQDDVVHPGVMQWFDVLKNGAPSPKGTGHAVFIEDGSGFWWNYGVAEALIVAGWQVTIVTPSAAIANNIPVESVPSLLGRLAAAKTEFRVLATLEDTEPGKVHISQPISGKTEEIPCDLLVIQTGRVSAAGPAAALRTSGAMEVHSIGDCVTPRRVSHALYEAQRLARVI